MRIRVTAILATAAVVTGALAAGGGSAGADAVGQQRPQFADAWGGSGSGDGNLENPRGVAVNDFGEIYVADTANDRIVQYDADGRFLTSFGTNLVAGVPLDNPWDVAVDANEFVWVADTGNHRIVRYGRSGGAGFPVGSRGAGNLRFQSPKGIDVDTGNDVWVADSGNDKIKVYEFDGTFQFKFGSTGSANGQFDDPRDVAIGLEGLAYVADTGNDRVQVFSAIGAFDTSFGGTGSASRRFESPQGVWIGGNQPPSDSVFVADTGNDRVTVWDIVGGVPTFERKFGGTGSLNRQMEAPRNVVLGDDERRYVVDTANDRLQVFDPPVTEGIAGTITDAVSGAGFEHALATISDATTFDLVAVAEADADGDYQATVPPGDYSVAFLDPSGSYDSEYFDDQADFTTFTPVTVTAGAVTAVDAGLTPQLVNAPSNPGNIAGEVTEAAGPAAGTWVVAVDALGEIARAVQADPTGHYEINALEAGNYVVLFLDPRGVNVTEFFDDTPDPNFATPLVVSLGTTVTADAELAP